MTGRRQKFAVFSIDQDLPMLYTDFVMAKDSDEAEHEISEIRGRQTDGHLAMGVPSSFTPRGLRDLLRRLERMTPEDIDAAHDELKKQFPEEGT